MTKAIINSIDQISIEVIDDQIIIEQSFQHLSEDQVISIHIDYLNVLIAKLQMIDLGSK